MFARDGLFAKKDEAPRKDPTKAQAPQQPAAMQNQRPAIEAPRDSFTGGSIAAPVFASVAARLARP